MAQTFTLVQNEIIRYVYDETSKTENQLIEKLIVSDSEHLDFYLDCLSIKSKLNEIAYEPEEETVEKILEFSRNYKPVI